MNKLIILALTLSCGNTWADETSHELSLGLAVASGQSIYTGGKDRTQPFPVIDYQYKKFYFQGGELGFHLAETEHWEFNFGLGADFIGDKDRGDSRLLKDMSSLGIPVNANIETKFKSPIGHFSASYSTELTNKHDGNSFKLGYSAYLPVGSWVLVPRLSWQKHSEEVVNYFYGVDTASATDSRPLYQTGSSTSQSLGVLVLRPINDKLSFLGNIGITQYGDEITRSPIVDEDQALGIFAGMIYKIF